jgi:hypothetical protein
LKLERETSKLFHLTNDITELAEKGEIIRGVDTLAAKKLCETLYREMNFRKLFRRLLA